MKVAIFASGNGTNYEVLAEHFQKGDLPGDLALLFCDHPDAPVIKRAEKFHTPVVTFTVKSCGGKQKYEEKILQVLKDYQIDFIALAGYMRVIGPTILSEYEGRIVNLHPAYLPAYPGLHSIERAFADHPAETGVTVHYIDSGLDSGPVIAQKHVPIYDDDTVDTLEARTHECEHHLYPEALRKALLKFEEENK